MRIPIIAANWKMHKTGEEATSFVNQLGNQLQAETALETVICPPYPLLALIAESCHGWRPRRSYYGLLKISYAVFKSAIAAGKGSHLNENFALASFQIAEVSGHKVVYFIGLS